MGFFFNTVDDDGDDDDVRHIMLTILLRTDLLSNLVCE